tara:strand:+ start:575 stop:1111 length:537 start_codon:yes stop_codon:yes gene_type:complete
MANINDLAVAISNIMSQKGYDSGDPSVAIGLKREDGDPILDSRVMDGFNARFHGNHLIINYHSVMSPRDFHRKSVEDIRQNILDMFTNIEKFLKKECSAMGVGRLSLTPVGEEDILIQYLNRKRYNCVAKKVYKVRGKGAEEVRGDEQKLHKLDTIKNFIKENSILNIDNRLNKLRNV